MKTKTLGRIPVLKDDCRLYFDGQHDRWVLTAPHQMVFPDDRTLIVLQACDGCCSEQQIIRSLVTFSDLKGISSSDIEEILEEFERRGFIHSAAA